MAKTFEKKAVICNKRGFHARASAQFVKISSRFPCEVTVSKDQMEISGKSIMGLLLLAGAPGEEITIRASGEKAEEAVLALENFVGCGFREEE